MADANDLERRVLQLEAENEQAQRTIVKVMHNFDTIRDKAAQHKESYVNLMWNYLPTVDPSLARIPHSPLYEFIYPEHFQRTRSASVDDVAAADGISANGRGITGAVGRFAIGQIIGGGAFTTVYAARDTRSGARVVVKAIRKDTVRKVATLQRIDLELRMLSLLARGGDGAGADTGEPLSPADNPTGIICVHEALATPSTAYLVSERSGADLFEWHQAFVACGGAGGASVTEATTSKLVPEPHIRAIVGMLARALAHCHTRGVIHRDVKPENVLIEELDDAATVVEDGAAACRRVSGEGRGGIAMSRTTSISDFDATQHDDDDDDDDDDNDDARCRRAGDGPRQEQRRLRVRLIDFGCALLFRPPEEGVAATAAATTASDAAAAAAPHAPPPPPRRTAGAREPLVPPGVICGSPGFIAPEALVAAAPYDPRKLDSWSLGCVALELCLGMTWFQDHWLQPYLRYAQQTRKGLRPAARHDHAIDPRKLDFARNFARDVQANLGAAQQLLCCSASPLPHHHHHPAAPSAFAAAAAADMAAARDRRLGGALYGAPPSVAAANAAADRAEAAAAAHAMVHDDPRCEVTHDVSRDDIISLDLAGDSPTDITTRALRADPEMSALQIETRQNARSAELATFVFDALMYDPPSRPTIHQLAACVWIVAPAAEDAAAAGVPPPRPVCDGYDTMAADGGRAHSCSGAEAWGTTQSVFTRFDSGESFAVP